MNYLELYKLLNKSNCRECGLQTCMAFAHAVINAERKIEDCPHVDVSSLESLGGKIATRDREKEFEISTERLKKEAARVDLNAVADGLGCWMINGKLSVTCLGKEFLVDLDGSIDSLCHIHTWVTMPIYNYIITGGNAPLMGRWISFDELQRGPSMANFFIKRCVEPLRHMADAHSDVFFDLLDIFGGKPVDGFNADHARVIYPLPKVPFLLLYWRPEEHFESKLRILFDTSADSYLKIEPIYILGRGIVEMFKNIISRREEVLPKLLAL